MSARKWVMGCTVTAVTVVAIVIICGVVAYKHLTAVMPLPGTSLLADADSVGHAVLRLEPDNPWIRQMFTELSKYSAREPKTAELFPIEVIWSAHRTSSSADAQMLDISFGPRGRFFGMMTDLALWKAGRSRQEKVSRVEYGGEGITSFPGTPLPGHVFVRDNQILWASDLEAARKAVDLVVASEKQGPAAATAPATMISQMPDPAAHPLVGVILGEGGAVTRSLALLPGTELDMPEGSLGLADLTFQIDAASGDTATGEITLRFPGETPAADIDAAARELARRLGSLTWGDVVVSASPRTEPSRAIIAVEASGLAKVHARLLQEVVKVQRSIESGQSPAQDGASTDPETPKDPN